GKASGVTLPGAEVAKDLVVGNARSVRRKRSKAALIHGQRLRQSAINADTVGTFDPAIGSVATRQKHDAFAIWKPGDDLVMNSHAVAERSGAALVERELLGLSAIGGHDVDIEIAVVLGGECDPFSVG